MESSQARERTSPAGQVVMPATPAPVALSTARAWWHLVLFCLSRQARARQMVGIALVLLGFTTALVAVNTAAGRWGMDHWRFRVPPSPPPTFGSARIPQAEQVLTYEEMAQSLELSQAVPLPAPALGLEAGFAGACRELLDRSDFQVFSRFVVFSIFLSFLLPIWSLSFATESLGGEREARSLVWLLTRPLPRASVYLAKFVALLPWSVGLNVGGFGLLCAAAGPGGREAFRLYWSAVLIATLAFASLFHFIGAFFRRPGVVAIVYSFFLETILGNMPGYLKRVSIGFYTRCLMFDAAQDHGLQAEKPSVYLPVGGPAAAMVLVSVAVGVLVLGMVVFSRWEYREEI